MKRFIKTGDILIYLFAAILAVLIYSALVQNMEVTLKPYVYVMWLLYQVRFEFIPGMGYMEHNGLFIIGKDCLGGKLFVCLFFIFVICRTESCGNILKKLIQILNFCVFSILFSYIITAIRIAASIPFCEMSSFKLIHTVLSLIVYFGSGLALYAFLNSQRIKSYSIRRRE